jgi:hypothetical protein
MLVNFMIVLLTGRGAVLSTYELFTEPPLDISITGIMDISFTQEAFHRSGRQMQVTT